MTFEKVLDGAVRFINEDIVPGMNDWQEIAARIAIGRLYENQQSVLTFLQNNGIVRAFGVIDSDGNVDIDRLCTDLKREIQKKKKIQVAIPGFGKMSFDASDVDKLYSYIKE
jgi:hypothetical protein